MCGGNYDAANEDERQQAAHQNILHSMGESQADVQECCEAACGDVDEQCPA